MSSIGVIVRGGIGDVCVLMTKFPELREYHHNDKLNAHIFAPSGTTIKEILELHHFFDNYYVMPYKRNPSEADIPHYDKVYNFNLWNGSDVVTIDNLYPEFESQWFFPLTTTRTPNKNAIIHMWGGTNPMDWGLKNWIYLTKNLIEVGLHPILLGRNECVGIDGLEHCINYNKQTSIVDTINMIYNSRLLIGVDSGLKNISLISGVPTIMLYDSSFPMARKDVWFPKYYQQFSQNKIFDISTNWEKVFEQVKSVLSLTGQL